MNGRVKLRLQSVYEYAVVKPEQDKWLNKLSENFTHNAILIYHIFVKFL